MGHPSIIEVNGKIYDAETGRLLRSKNSSDKNPSPKQGPVKNVDGVIHSGNPANLHKKLVNAKQSLENTAKEVSRRVAPHAQRVSEHSKTLMRKAVKKPDSMLKPSGLKPKIQTNQYKPLDRMMAGSAAAVKPVIDGALARAQTIQKSQLVTKFNELKAARPEPKPEVIQELKALPTVDDVHAKNLAMLKEQEELGIDSVAESPSLAAIEKATSYKPIGQDKKARVHVRMAQKLRMKPRAFVAYVAILLAAVIIGTAIYEYSNNIVFYIYEKKIGISTSLPSYVVPGFRLSVVSRAGDSVSVNYKSNSDTRSYLITEQASNWDSQSLLEGVVTPSAGSNYTSLEANGRIVYLFGKDAVWVDSGTYYVLLNNANLSSNQLTQIIDGS